MTNQGAAHIVALGSEEVFYPHANFWAGFIALLLQFCQRLVVARFMVNATRQAFGFKCRFNIAVRLALSAQTLEAVLSVVRTSAIA